MLNDQWWEELGGEYMNNNNNSSNHYWLLHAIPKTCFDTKFPLFSFKLLIFAKTALSVGTSSKNLTTGKIWKFLQFPIFDWKSEIENHDKTKEMSAGFRLFRFEFNSWPGHQPPPRNQSALSSSVDKKQPSVEINKSINVLFHTSLIKSGPFYWPTLSP